MKQPSLNWQYDVTLFLCASMARGGRCWHRSPNIDMLQNDVMIILISIRLVWFWSESPAHLLHSNLPSYAPGSLWRTPVQPPVPPCMWSWCLLAETWAGCIGPGVAGLGTLHLQENNQLDQRESSNVTYVRGCELSPKSDRQTVFVNMGQLNFPSREITYR